MLTALAGTVGAEDMVGRGILLMGFVFGEMRCFCFSSGSSGEIVRSAIMELMYVEAEPRPPASPLPPNTRNPSAPVLN